MKVWMREPGEELARCELTHVEREPIDVGLARQQHAQLARTLEELGCDVCVLPALPGQPDACFVQDVALLLGEAAVLCSPGAGSRRGEVSSIGEELGASHSLLDLAAAAPPGATLEGGDVLRVDDVLYVGMSTRTNHAGLKALAHLVLAEGFRVKAAGVRGCLHLETGATRIGSEQLLVNPSWVDLERADDLEQVPVDPAEPFGANVLRVGDCLVASDAHPLTNQRLRELGHRVREVAIGELHRAEAGVTCLALCERS